MTRFFIFAVSLIAVSSAYLPNARAEFTEGKKALYGSAGYTRGGLGLGVDFEYGYHRTFGIGGFVRMYQDETDPAANGGTVIGAFVRPHFNRQAWDFYLSPGFSFTQFEPSSGDSETLIGPSLGLGLLYEFTPTLSVGFEHLSVYSWFGEEDYRGQIFQNLFASARFIF